MKQAVMRREAGCNSKVQIVTVVWGEAFVTQLLTVAWRSILAPGNLPAFVERFDTTYILYIRDVDLPVVYASPQYKLISALVEVETRVFSEKEMHRDKYEWHWILWKDAVARASAPGSVMVLIIPDLLYADGTLARWGDYLLSGRRAVFSIGTWVSRETCMAELTARYPIESNDTVAISRQELVQLLMRHLHPLIAASFRNSGHASFHPERITEFVHNEGFLSRMLSSQPFMFDTQHFRLDGSQCPVNHFDDIAFDDVTSLSLAPILHLGEFYNSPVHFNRHRIAHIAGWSNHNLRIAHFFESRFDYRYPQDGRPPDNEAWTKASANLDGARRQILAAHVIKQVWECVAKLGCSKAASLIAIAALHHHLNEKVWVEGGFTVFVPTDAALAQWGLDVNAMIASEDANAAFFPIVLDHIVDRRLYLRAGDALRLSPASERGYGRGPSTLGGASLSIIRSSPGSPEHARVVTSQERVGFGVVYLIDSVLHHTD